MAVIKINPYEMLELKRQNESLRQQLAEYERERDQFKGAVGSYMKAYDDCREEHTNTHAKLVIAERERDEWRQGARNLQCEHQKVSEQLATVTKERDEILEALGLLSFHCDGVTRTDAPPRDIYNKTFAVYRKYKDALAKVGADKTGDES